MLIVRNFKDGNQKVYINPRGYLEYQLQVNQNMQEVSQHFRCIRDILFGQQITVESQRARVQNLEQLGAQLANQLKKPPNYTQLSKESLQEIEKRMVQIAANATSEIRFSIAKDTTLLTQNDQSFKSKLQNFLKSEIKTESSPTYKSHFTSFGLGTGQNSVEQLKENNRQLQQSSLNPLHLSSVESSIQQYNKEYLINRILDSNHKEDNAYNLHAKQNNLKQSQQEYDYNKKQSKVITFAGDGSSVDYTTFNIQSEEKVKNSSQNKNFQKTLAKDEEVNQNNNHQNRINNFQDKNQLNYNNKYNQSLKTPQPKENYNRSMDSNPNQIFSNIDELEAITPLQSVTPQKSNSSNWYDYQPQQPSLLNQTLSTQGKHTSSQQSMPTQQINIQSQQSTWQQMQTNLDTIPELNQSSSVNSLFAQQLSNTSHPLQDIEIMEGSKSVRIKTRNNNSISLTQIPKEIELKQDKVNCLCVVGGALIACGDSKGCIKLYNLSTQTCIGEYGAHKQSISCISPFQADQPYILSGSTGDNLIHLWNIIDEKQNIVLKDYSNQPSSQTSIKSSQSLNINFVSSLFDERNIISVVNNFSIISVWDTKDKKKIQNIKPIIQQGDTSASQVTSILSMGKQMQSILIGFKCCKVGIFKIDYENSKNYQDQNKIKQISLLKSVDLGKGNVPSNLVNLFNSKVFITIKKSVLVWDTKSFELSEKIESYLNDSNIQDICDILVIQYADANSYSVIQVSKNDNRIILQNKNQAATKHHMKDFKIVDSLFKEKLQFCKSHNNELFIVGLNQNKNTLIYWKMFDSL